MVLYAREFLFEALYSALCAMNTKTNTNKSYNMEHTIVYKMSIAMKLIELGHKVFTTMPNPQKPHLICWVFEWDETIEEDIRGAAYGK